MLAESGIDYFAVVPFTPELAAYSAEDFVEHVLRRRFRMRELLIGHDHGFGQHRAGNVNVLRALGAARGFQVDVVDAVSLSDGQHVSSTSIRRAVAGGDLERAAEGLGRPYSVGGTVVRGKGSGPGARLSHAQPGSAVAAEASAAGRCLRGSGADAARRRSGE